MMKTSNLSIGFLSLAVFGLFASAAIADDTLKTKIDSMFVIASSGDFKFRDLVQPTIEDMGALGVEAVPYLIDRLGTEDARERMTLEEIFKKIGAPAVPLLNRALLETDSLQLSRVATILFYLPDSSSVDNLIKVADNPFYWVRYQVLRALGKIGDIKAGPTVEKAMADDNELVRAMAAVAAGRIDAEAFFPYLSTALEDSYYGVRMSALEEIGKIDCVRKTALIENALEDKPDNMTRKLLLSLMASDSCVYNAGILQAYLADTDPVVQSLALEALYKSDGSRVIDLFADSFKTSESLILRQTIEKLIEKNEAQKTITNP